MASSSPPSIAPSRRFRPALSSRRFSIGRLKLAAAVVGFNFHFGKGRAGTPAVSPTPGKRKGFAVTVVDQVLEPDGAPVSSTAIRENLAAGEIAAANARLGYRWFVVGEVVPGERRGRELGYPTANIRLPADCRLRHGIYAVRMQRADGTLLDGVASYGRRPTFDNGAPLLEVFVFDFSGDLYGEEVSVAFVGWIRPELKFDSGRGPRRRHGPRRRNRPRECLAAAGPGTPSTRPWRPGLRQPNGCRPSRIRLGMTVDRSDFRPVCGRQNGLETAARAVFRVGDERIEMTGFTPQPPRDVAARWPRPVGRRWLGPRRLLRHDLRHGQIARHADAGRPRRHRRDLEREERADRLHAAPQGGLAPERRRVAAAGLRRGRARSQLAGRS